MLAVLKLRWCFKLAFMTILGAFTMVALVVNVNEVGKRTIGRYAYVFYATRSDYLCHAFVNIRRMIRLLHVDETVDFVIVLGETLDVAKISNQYHIMTEFPNRIKLVHLKRPGDPQPGSDTYYKDCFVKLAVFQLYNLYDRIIYMDSDGLILRNTDHLFTQSIQPYQIAATWHHPWHISSSFFVADLSHQLSRKVIRAVQPDGLQRVFDDFNNSSAVYDMEVLNYLFAHGHEAYLLPSHYSIMDRYLADPRTAPEIALVYYVHFSMLKPFYHDTETRTFEKSNKYTPEYRQIFRIFWLEEETACVKR